MREKNLVRVLVCLLMFVFAAGASAGPPTTSQIAEMVELPGGADAPGGATLVRSRQSLSVNLAMSGLEADAAYSVWWVVWSNPAACTDECDESDFFVPGNRIFYATGFIASADGTANVDAETRSGKTPVGAENLTGNRGLKPGRGFASEALVIVRRHGPPTLGSVGIQTGTFEPNVTEGGVCPDLTCFNEFGFAFPPV